MGNLQEINSPKNAREVTAAEVAEVFAYFSDQLQHPRTLLTAGRAKVLRQRMAEEVLAGGDPVAGMKLAVDGARDDAWFSGRDPATNGRRYWGFENVFVHAGRDRIEKLQAAARAAKEPQQQAPVRRGTVAERSAANIDRARETLRLRREAAVEAARREEVEINPAGGKLARVEPAPIDPLWDLFECVRAK